MSGQVERVERLRKRLLAALPRREALDPADVADACIGIASFALAKCEAGIRDRLLTQLDTAVRENVAFLLAEAKFPSSKEFAARSLS